MRILVATLLLMALSGCGSTQSVRFYSGAGPGAPWLKVQGDEYLVAGATEATLGGTGFRVSDVNGDNVLSPWEVPETPQRITGNTITVDRVTFDAVEAEAHVNAPEIPLRGAATGSAEIDGQVGTSTGTTERYLFTIVRLRSPALRYAEIRDAWSNAPADSDTRDQVESDDFRFVTAVVLAAEFKVQQNVALQANISGDSTVDGGVQLDVHVGATSDESQTVTLSRDAVVAYRWHAICWVNGRPSRSVLVLRQWWGARPKGCRSYGQSNASSAADVGS